MRDPYLGPLIEIHRSLQGTKVLEDRELRNPLSWLSVDAPPRHIFSPIVKYTGALVAPEWEDIERGIVFGFPGNL